MATTVGGISRLFNVAPQTVRTWCEQFGDYLSPTAVPPSGETRIFTNDDLLVLALVADMREALAGYEDIRAALARGERGKLPQREEEERASDETATALALRYEAQLAFKDGQLSQLAEERDHLREELREERTARTTAEKEASRLQGKLEALEARSGGGEASQSPTYSLREEQARPWWRRLLGRNTT